MIRTYLADVTPLYEDAVYQRFYESVPGWRKEKADKFRHRSDQALSIGAWALYDRVRTGAHSPDEAVYNLSHSGTYVLCSIGDEPDGAKVGCDVETMKRIRMNVAKKFFRPGEYEHLLQTEDDWKQKELFYRYWVLKESFMKATRMGMKLSMQSFEIDFDAKDRPYLKDRPPEFAEAYYYKEYQAEQARIAVCSTDPLMADTLEVIALEEDA